MSQLDMPLSSPQNSSSSPHMGGGRGRLEEIERRVARLQAIWDDEDMYLAVVASGRHLKLCMVTEQANGLLDEIREKIDREKKGEENSGDM